MLRTLPRIAWTAIASAITTTTSAFTSGAATTSATTASTATLFTTLRAFHRATLWPIHRTIKAAIAGSVKLSKLSKAHGLAKSGRTTKGRAHDPIIIVSRRLHWAWLLLGTTRLVGTAKRWGFITPIAAAPRTIIRALRHRRLLRRTTGSAQHCIALTPTTTAAATTTTPATLAPFALHLLILHGLIRTGLWPNRGAGSCGSGSWVHNRLAPFVGVIDHWCGRTVSTPRTSAAIRTTCRTTT